MFGVIRFGYFRSQVRVEELELEFSHLKSKKSKHNPENYQMYSNINF